MEEIFYGMSPRQLFLGGVSHPRKPPKLGGLGRCVSFSNGAFLASMLLFFVGGLGSPLSHHVFFVKSGCISQ